MNDKCAAGTGRFLEVISPRLAPTSNSSTALPKMSRRTHHEYVHSVCRIRSDQPALSGVAPEAILAGVINAMARRSAISLLVSPVKRRFCLLVALVTSKVYPHAGKPSGNAGTNSPCAQFAGAIGAAVIGQRQRKRDERVSVFISLHGRRHTNPQGLQAAGMTFRVSDIPRYLRGGAGYAFG